MTIINPDDWTKHPGCADEAPADPYIELVLEQKLRGERCVIERYKEIADFINGKDYASQQMAVAILNEELEHENDIEDWITDLQGMKDEFKKTRL